jgi:hypothetical protein
MLDMTTRRPNLLERAFELAATGEYSTVTQIRFALRKEGYEAVEPQLVGPMVRRQLRSLMDEASVKRSDVA